MPIYPLLKDGAPALAADGRPRFKVVVWDSAAKRQISRRAVGEDEAYNLEADLLAACRIPQEQRAAVSSADADATGVSGSLLPRYDEAANQRLTVNQWAAIYLQMYKTRPNGSARPLSSWDHDRRCLEYYIAPRIGQRTLASIRLRDLDDLMASVTKKDGVTPLSGHTKESIAGTIKRLFKLAERRGIVGSNPAARLPTSWGGQSEDRTAIVPSLADVERLAGAAEERAAGFGEIIRLIACTGMRWEEFSALPVELVDWDDRSLLVEWTATVSGGRRHLVRQTKSKAGRRRIPIINQVIDPLERLIALGDERRKANPGFGSEVLVVTGTDGAALSYPVWRDVIGDARSTTGIDLTAHELRHVAASLFIAGELRPDDIAEIMGHANAEYTKRVYGHLFPRDGRPLAKRLSDAYAALEAEERKLALLREERELRRQLLQDQAS